ncbi:hypothetical protein [Lysinibacillus sphaericus]|uniref:hypothetical protein n=1 Tax=Lysinibacillus sphaericus TaxID=1421 RepID=UPI0021051BB3|nr:hypothetical protein [Lysinibacillus sp. SDF0037]
MIPNLFDEVLEILDKNFDCFDLIDSSNYGLNNYGKLVFIDYGMTKKLYEKEWVPLAEEGILPQIHFDFCIVCGLEKELRIYGDDDKTNVVMIVVRNKENQYVGKLKERNYLSFSVDLHDMDG